MGRALGRLLHDAGEPVTCVASRNLDHARAAAAAIGPNVGAVAYAQLPAHAVRLLICVPDSALEEVAATVPATSGLALHTCGARGPDALRPLALRGVACGAIHPLQTLTAATPSDALRGIAFAVAGHPDAVAWAARIAALAGGTILPIRDELRPLYHAAAVMASNYLTALLDAARILIIAAGVPPAAALPALAPLVRTSIENALALGPAAALTGPIERGDAVTVAHHLRALAAAPATLRSLYCAAGLHTLDLARARGLAPGPSSAIESLLQEHN